MNETRALSDFVARLRYEDLPRAVVDQACRILIDTIGCAISAWSEDPEKARVALEIARLYGAATGASVIGAPDVKCLPAFAALANGILANAADNDDTHKLSLLHVGSVVVPITLALGETQPLRGRDLITSLVAGYEVGVRVGMGVLPSHHRFWHSTGTNGTFAAAACAAKALGLDADGVQRALGLAAMQAGGLNTFIESGDMTKSIHPGKSALAGILSAQLARLGATSSPSVLEHPKGYLNAYSTDPKPEALTRGLGTSWEILQNGFKHFPSVLTSHSPIQATLAIVNKHSIDPRQIARIINETYETVMMHFANKEVDSEMAARLSVPYCIAVSTVDRKLTPAQFSRARFSDPLVREVLSKTELIANAEFNKLRPDNFPARVTITMKSGKSFQEMVLFPKGDPQDPLSASELEEKFRANVADKLSPASATQLLDSIYALPQAPDASELTSRLHD